MKCPALIYSFYLFTLQIPKMFSYADLFAKVKIYVTQKSSPLIGNAVTIQHQRLEVKMRVRVTLERNIWESEYLHLNVVFIHCWKTQRLCFWFFGDRISFCFKYFFFWFFSSSTGWRYADCCIWSGPTTHTFVFQFKTPYLNAKLRKKVHSERKNLSLHFTLFYCET